MGVSHGSFCAQIGKINFVYHEKSLISWALVTLESDTYSQGLCLGLCATLGQSYTTDIREPLL